ncbi:SAM-dependent methyltransferase [Amycolatopsis sp. NPDC003861]
MVVQDVSERQVDAVVAGRDFAQPPQHRGFAGEGVSGDGQLQPSGGEAAVGRPCGEGVQQDVVVDGAARQAEQDRRRGDRAGCLALSHLTDETAPADLRDQVRACIDTYQDSASPLVARGRGTITGWLGGLHLIPPGITVANRWHPDDDAPGGPEHDLVIAGLAQLPS